jgi:hypothetical protein
MDSKMTGTTGTCPGGTACPGGAGQGHPVRGVSLSRPSHRTSVSSRELLELATRVERLTVSHRNPERFHCEKSEIAYSLREIYRALK